MRKTILLSLVFAVSAAMLCLARPIRGSSSVQSESFSLEPTPEPLNTDYVRVDPTYTGSVVWQETGVYVGKDTDFSVGTHIVFDITVLEWDQEHTTTFAVHATGSGFSWLKLYATESVPPGRHTIEFTIQDGGYAPYFVKIDENWSLSQYTNYWGQRKERFIIGNGVSSWGAYFRGLYHSIKMYDAYGILRHYWTPDLTGRFFDEIEQTYSTIGAGRFVYGDLANE